MSCTLPQPVKEALTNILQHPCLATSRALEQSLLAANYGRQVFGRVNQKSSIEAASESDRGVTERLANAFDASLTAARIASDIQRSDKSLTPRNAARKFFCARTEASEWLPDDSRLQSIRKPIVEFWSEPEDSQRFRKHRPSDGLVTVLMEDSGTGLAREKMPNTILTLNSESKLKEFEAIGQFGHGGSSALAFCESCLIISQPRTGDTPAEFSWTLIFPEQDPEDSKQQLIRRWFCSDDHLPLRAAVAEFDCLRDKLPGTLVWHFGYNRGGWIKRIAGSEQTNPWGRLGRLFFSYPLPFEIRGEFARADSPAGRRTIKGAFYRIIELAAADVTKLGEKAEALIVAGQNYGNFNVHVFVFKESGSVRNYVDPNHPVLLTLNGQNHGELTRTLISNAGFPEISARAIIEVRLDGLEQEALSEIISNSREQPKSSDFTRMLRGTLETLLQSDPDLEKLERQLEEEKARQSSADLSRKMSEFLSRILSNASGNSDASGEGNAAGEKGTRGETSRLPIPAADPPSILEFLHDTPVFVPDGGRVLVKFKSDARPPKYSFHGDNPRCFARFEISAEPGSRVAVVGQGDISDTGHGSVSLACAEHTTEPIKDRVIVGKLTLTIQSADGRLLSAQVDVGVKPKPEARDRAARQEVKTVIIFCAPDNVDRVALGLLIGESSITGFDTGLKKYCGVLELPEEHATYWGDKSDRDGISHLSIEINVGNKQLQSLFQECRDVSERIAAKERYVRDIVLDCYQHSFVMANTPDTVRDALSNDLDEKRRAADIHFNHDKAVRIARHELHSSR